MTTITREIINKELTFTIYKNDTDSYTINYTELIELIDRAKTYLINEKQVKIRDKVFICPCDLYIVWLFACAELGLSLIISTSHELKSFKKIEQLYGKIDYFIVLNNSYFKFITDKYQNISINPDVILEYYNLEHKDINNTHSKLLLTISVSETNLKYNDHTVFNHSHEFYYRLLIRNKNILNLDINDKCMHNKVLHHGSSLGTFFLPTIFSCKSHYWIPEHIQWNKIVVNEQINRCLFMYYDIINFRVKFFNRTVDLSFLTIYTLRSPSNRDIVYYINKCNSTIISIFGTTLSSGPIFLQTINKDNSDTFNNENFGKLLDNFYQVEIENSKLVIKTFDNRVIKTKDRFRCVDNCFYII